MCAISAFITGELPHLTLLARCIKSCGTSLPPACRIRSKREPQSALLICYAAGRRYRRCSSCSRSSDTTNRPERV